MGAQEAVGGGVLAFMPPVPPSAHPPHPRHPTIVTEHFLNATHTCQGLLRKTEWGPTDQWYLNSELNSEAMSYLQCTHIALPPMP